MTIDPLTVVQLSIAGTAGGFALLGYGFAALRYRRSGDERVSGHQPLGESRGQPASATDDHRENALLVQGSAKLERELAKAKAELARLRENERALRELARTPPVRDKAPTSNQDVGILARAVETLQKDLAQALRDASTAEQKYLAMRELLTERDSEPDSPTRPTTPRHDEIEALHLAIQRLERDLGETRKEASEARDKLRSYSELSQKLQHPSIP